MKDAKINVVIPIGKLGSRFDKDGYEKHKLNDITLI
jgi:hypothetical protein